MKRSAPKQKRALVVRGFVLAGLGTGWLFLQVGMERARRQAESINCCSQIVSICLAARMWAQENSNALPRDFASMRNELSTPKVLHCPADKVRPQAQSWTDLQEVQSSYELVQPGAPDGDTNAVFLRCRVHGHQGYADGTVFDGVRRRGNQP